MIIWQPPHPRACACWDCIEQFCADRERDWIRFHHIVAERVAAEAAEHLEAAE